MYRTKNLSPYPSPIFKKRVPKVVLNTIIQKRYASIYKQKHMYSETKNEILNIYKNMDRERVREEKIV